MTSDVNEQVTDGITQANLTVVGSGPAMAILQSELSLAQAQGVLFANMISNQHQLALSSNAALTEGVMQLYRARTKASAKSQRDEKLAYELGNLANSLKAKKEDPYPPLAIS